MKLTPRLALRLEPCEIEALEFNQCYTNAVRRMEEKRRGELTGPAEYGGDEIPPGATISGDGRRQAQ